MPTSSEDKGSSSREKKDSSGTPPTQAFTSPPSARALGLVAIAILIGFLLVMIVDSDKPDKKSSSAVATQQTTTTTTTAKSNTKKSSASSSTTSTPKAVSGAHDPAEVSVLVLNGSNIAGVAAQVSTKIGDLDYKMLTPGNDTSKDDGTFVYYKSGFSADANQLATNVVPGILKTLKMTQTVKTAQFPASAPTAWDQTFLVGANVVVIIGNPPA